MQAEGDITLSIQVVDDSLVRSSNDVEIAACHGLWSDVHHGGGWVGVVGQGVGLSRLEHVIWLGSHSLVVVSFSRGIFLDHRSDHGIDGVAVTWLSCASDVVILGADVSFSVGSLVFNEGSSISCFGSDVVSCISQNVEVDQLRVLWVDWWC